VSKASTQPDLSVCKAERVVLRAKLIDFFNNRVHATMVEYLCHSTLLLVMAEGFSMGKRPSDLHA